MLALCFFPNRCWSTLFLLFVLNSLSTVYKFFIYSPTTLVCDFHIFTNGRHLSEKVFLVVRHMHVTNYGAKKVYLVAIFAKVHCVLEFFYALVVDKKCKEILGKLVAILKRSRFRFYSVYTNTASKNGHTSSKEYHLNKSSKVVIWFLFHAFLTESYSASEILLFFNDEKKNRFSQGILL